MIVLSPKTWILQTHRAEMFAIPSFLSPKEDPILFLDKQFESAVRLFDAGKIEAMQNKIDQVIFPLLAEDVKSRYYELVSSLEKRILKIQTQKQILDEDRKDVRKTLLYLKGMKFPKLVRLEKLASDAALKLARAESAELSKEYEIFDNLVDLYYRTYDFQFSNNTQVNYIAGNLKPIAPQLHQQIYASKELQKDVRQCLDNSYNIDNKLATGKKDDIVRLAFQIRKFAEFRLKRKQMLEFVCDIPEEIPREIRTIIQQYAATSEEIVEECKLIEHDLSGIAQSRFKIHTLLLKVYNAVNNEDMLECDKYDTFEEVLKEISEILEQIKKRYFNVRCKAALDDIINNVSTFIMRSKAISNQRPMSVDNLQFLAKFLTEVGLLELPKPKTSAVISRAQLEALP